MSTRSVVTLMLFVSLAVLARAASAQITSVTGRPAGASVDGREPHVTPDGRFISYHSSSNTLVPGDGNLTNDCFLYDSLLDTVVRVSVGPAGVESNASSFSATVSDDGTRVAFESVATNLVDDDTNNLTDVFVHDLTTGETTRVSVGPGGSQATGTSRNPRISGNGRYVVFESDAPDLVIGDTNGHYDIFVHDLEQSVTSRESVSSFGLQGDSTSWKPSISTSGRWVAFESEAITLVLNDQNGVRDIFVRDRVSNQTTLVSRSTAGVPADQQSYLAQISGDGSAVVFLSFASTLDDIEPVSTDADVFVHQLDSATTVRASVDVNGNETSGFSNLPSISFDGRFVTFQCYGTDLVEMPDTNAEPDVFQRDLETGTTVMVSLETQGDEGISGSYSSMTADGRYVVFDGDVLYLRDTFIPWTDRGHALAGTTGEPTLSGEGTLEGNTVVSLTLADALPNAQVFLVGGPALLLAPFEGGTMVPQPSLILGLGTDAAGGFFFPILWPSDVPSGNSFHLQCWIPDAGGIYGYAASNGLSLTQP